MRKIYFNNKGFYLNKKVPGGNATGDRDATGFFGKLDCHCLFVNDIQICCWKLEVSADGIFEIGRSQYEYAILYNQQQGCYIRTGGSVQIDLPNERMNLFSLHGLRLSFGVKAGYIYGGWIFLFRQKILDQCYLLPFQSDSLYALPVKPSISFMGIIQDIHNSTYPWINNCVFSAIKTKELLFVLWDEAGLLNNSKNKNEGNHQLFESIRQFIAADPCTHYSIKKLSLRFGINTTYLKTGFRKQFGKGVFEYLLELRMIQSRRLLANGMVAVSVIADKVGYSNTASYIKAFKRYYGFTPGQIRKTYLNNT